MGISSFDEELKRNARQLLCPNCENKVSVPITEEEAFCDECGEEFSIEEDKDDFIWHPSENY